MESLVLSVAGLYSNMNEFSAVPNGALSVANNIVVSKNGIAEPRRGFDRLAFTLPLTTDRAIQLLQYQNTLMVHYRGTQLGYYNGNVGVVPYTGAYSSPDPNLALIKYAEANQNLYFTSTKGIQKLDSITHNPVQAGMFKGLDCLATGSPNASGFMLNEAQVAYRVVWGTTDANDNLVLGAPSQQAVIANTSGQNQDVSVQTTIPAGVTVNNFYQLYRGDQAPAAYISASGTIQDLSFTAAPEYEGPPGNYITVQYAASYATLAINGLTYKAITSGSLGNLISIAYTSGGTAGSEVVSVTGTAISVQIQSGVSTTNQIKTAVNLSAAATALVSLSGGSSSTQTTVATTFLAGGIAPGSEIVSVTYSTATINTLLYTSVAGGGAGQQVTIAYTTGGTAGSEVVSVTGTAISVQIQSGVSTTADIETAVNASSTANVLVVASGGSGTTQTAPVSATALTGGYIQVLIASGLSTATDVYAAINANSTALNLINPLVTGVATNTQTAPASVTLASGAVTLVTPDDNMQQVYEGSVPGSTLVLQDLTYTSVYAGTLGNSVYVGYTSGGTAGAELVTVLPSTLVVQDITYTTVAVGGPGDLVSVTYTAGGVAGAEVVTVYGNAVTVQIASGVSTAAQVLAAIMASSSALNVLSAAITGTAGHAQTSASIAYAAGGAVNVKIHTGVSTANQILAAVNASVAALDLVSVVVSGTGTNTQTSAAATACSGGSATLTILDEVPDSLRGAALYTNATQQGILQAYELPPYAEDMDVFRNCLFFGNTRTKQILLFSILAVGGTNGIQLNDTITIAGVTYTATSTENVASQEYALVTSGSAAQNINDTALSLVRVINQTTANTAVYAYYVSSPEGLPGQISIQERILGGATYYSTVSARGSAFSPAMPTSGTSVSSTNQVNLNGLMYSVQQQPDAVPTTNILYVGSASKKIIRVLALRDSLFILKEDGVFRCTGSGPSTFAIDLIDNTATILAPESAVTLSNQIFALTTQGVVSISDTGVEVMSRPIEDQLLTLFGSALVPLQYYSFGVGYESDREYILWTVSQATDTMATQAFVYNVFTKAWTRWSRTQGPGLILNADNKLYVTDPTTNYINQERKNLNYTDYIDESLPLTIVSSSGYNITVSDASFAVVGDMLYQSTSVASLITAVNIPTGVITTADNLPWSAGTAYINKAIACLLEWTPNPANGQPGYLKQWSETALQFKTNSFTNAAINFYSEISTGIDSVPIIGTGNGTWGNFPWGSISWGGLASRRLQRTYVPLEKQRCGVLSVQFACQEAWASFALEGGAHSFRYISTRTSN